MEIAESEVWAVSGMVQNFPFETLQQPLRCSCSVRPRVVMQ